MPDDDNNNDNDDVDREKSKLNGRAKVINPKKVNETVKSRSRAETGSPRITRV